MDQIPRDAELRIFGAHLIAFINASNEVSALTGEDPLECRYRILSDALDQFKSMPPDQLRQAIIVNLMPIMQRRKDEN